ncbi:DUF6261 family protein [Streptococcus sanguinis]|uniref:DUF6261 family protein n=1 Tax=Streptococcus sanguinis TaxID=1305 RepID=UPI0022E82593|nr:DUF6261 family protein [Streptococcus sanguinis]
MKKVYEVKGLSLSDLDNQELSQLFAESQKLVDEFSKTNKQELTYISKLARFTPLFEDFQATLHKGASSKVAKDLSQADRERDEAVTTLFSLHRGYALVKTPAIKEAYESLASLFKSYQGMTIANYEKESESITHLLGKLAAAPYKEAVEQLNLTAFVAALKSSQAAFERVYKARLTEMEGKKPGKAKELRTKLIELYEFFVDYTAISAYAYPDKAYFASLRDQLNAIRSRYQKRKPAKKAEKAETEASK